MVDTILRLPAVKARTGLARSTIYLRVKQGTFPKPISLGARAVGWIERELDQWLAQQIKQSRGGQLDTQHELSDQLQSDWGGSNADE